MNGVEITMDSFIEALENLRDKFFTGSDAAWDLFIDLVRENDRLNLYEGPVSVLREFSNDMETIERDVYEIEYPKYSKIMSWDEFVQNECLGGNDEVAILMPY